MKELTKLLKLSKGCQVFVGFTNKPKPGWEASIVRYKDFALLLKTGGRTLKTALNRAIKEMESRKR